MRAGTRRSGDRALGWWRRNAVALLALVVLFPVTIGVIGFNEWSQFDQGHSTRPLFVEPGDAVFYAGAGIGPARSEFADDVNAPAGARVVRVTVLITPGRGPISCGVPTLRETTGLQRQWNEASLDLDLPYDPEGHTVCDSERPIRYALTVHYLVPRDAVGPFTLDLVSSDQNPEYLRMLVEP